MAFEVFHPTNYRMNLPSVRFGKCPRGKLSARINRRAFDLIKTTGVVFDIQIDKETIQLRFDPNPTGSFKVPSVAGRITILGLAMDAAGFKEGVYTLIKETGSPARCLLKGELPPL